MARATTDKEFRQLIEKLQLQNTDVVRGTIFAMGSDIIQSSPVGNYKLWKKYQANPRAKKPKGYTGGRFRGAWQSTLDRPSGRVTLRKDKTGSKSQERLMKAVEALQAGNTFYMTNNLPYAIELEFGHSTQAPTGIVRKVLLTYNEAITKAQSKARR